MQKSIDAMKKILEDSGAKDLILAKKGSVEIKISKLRVHPKTVYETLVSMVDAHGADGKKEVTSDRKTIIYASGVAGGIIASYFRS